MSTDRPSMPGSYDEDEPRWATFRSASSVNGGKFAVQVEWHSPDQVFAAGFLRDGQPWILGGALVGMGDTQGDAVADLTGIARHLVIHGVNGLLDGPLPLADREWLFSLLDPGSDDDEMYAALHAVRRTAGEG